jgi:hypothetical protein
MKRKLSPILILLVLALALAGCLPPAPTESTPTASAPAASAATAVSQPSPQPATVAAPETQPTATAQPEPVVSPAAAAITLRLLTPDLAQPVELAPSLTLEAVPGAVSYVILIIDAGTTELVLRREVNEPSLTVAEPLQPGRTYTLSITAFDRARKPIAQSEAVFTTAGEAVAPGDAATLQLPARCYREGLLTHVDRDAALCFAYPPSFSTGGPDGPYSAGSLAAVELRGPAHGAGPEPLFARLSVEFLPYQGVDLAPFVDEMIKAEVPAGFAQIERTQAEWAGHGVEILEPWPGQLSARRVIIDASPAGYHVLTFWPVFDDTPGDKLTEEAIKAQEDMEALFAAVSETFATLPPPGVPFAEGSGVVVPNIDIELQPSAIAPSYTVQLLPAQPPADDVPPFETHPPLAAVLLPGYAGREASAGPLAFGEPVITVYRVADLLAFEQAENPYGFKAQAEALQQLLAGDAPLTACNGVTAKPGQNITQPALPFLPLINAAQGFCTQAQRLDFATGQGIRYVTAFAQGPAGLTDQAVIYTFQGLTDDGQYYVSAVLPATTGVLPAEPGAIDPAKWVETLEGWTDQLAALPADAFTPSLTALDALIASITIQ